MNLLAACPIAPTGRRLLQWEGMDDDEAPQLLKEMHEHLDVRRGRCMWMDNHTRRLWGLAAHCASE
jgi:hypothetical protein